MKKIGDKFSIIGTNPQKYINNYLTYFVNISKQEKIEIDKNNYSLIHRGITILSFNSDATFRQNIDCWVGLGLFNKKNNILIKMQDDMNEFDFYEYIKSMLFVHSDNDNINIYRDTILIKLTQIIAPEILKNITLRSNTRDVDQKIIEAEIGKFEKTIIKDEKLKKILLVIWGEKNE
ncbi:MAG: hypothetical protein ACRCRZ_01830 [Metamycoplasmataceae bacterium]